MITALSVLGAFITILAAGFGLAVWLQRDAAELRGLELGALSWLLGTAFVSLALWIAGALVNGVTLQIAVALPCLALAFAGNRMIGARPSRLRWPRPRALHEWVLAGLLVAEAALVIYLALGHTLGWDGLLVWETKARYAFENGGVLPGGYFTDESRRFTHPEYPLLLPYTEAWLYLWLGEPNQFWVKLIFPPYFLAGVILLAHAGADWTGRRWAGLLAAACLFFIPYLTKGPGGLLFGYADAPLSFFYLGTVAFLLRFVRDDSPAALRLFAVLAGLLPWVKREGAVLWLVVGGCGFLFVWRQRGLRRALLTLMPAIIILASWRIFSARMHIPAPQDFIPVTLTSLRENLPRAALIVRELLSEMSRRDHWALLWIAVLLAFVCLAARARHARTLLLVAVTAGPIPLFGATYLFSTWPELANHVQSSLPRLLMQLVPVALLAIAAAAASPRER